jgi:hypothetical protein
MSIAIIEEMIKAALQDEKISLDEKDAVLKKAKEYNISEVLVLELIKAEEDKIEDKKTLEAKQKLEHQEKKTIETEEKELEKKRKKAIKNAGELSSKFNDSYWAEGIFGEQATTWIPFSIIITGVIGIVNAATHDKAWYAYIGMFLLFSSFGFVFYAITYLISMLTKRVPFLDWHKPVLIAFGVLVLAIICYLVIPF